MIRLKQLCLVCRFADPLMFGDYPKTMKKNVGSRLPSFDRIESRLVKGSADFLAINFYLASKVKDNPWSLDVHPRDYKTDIAVQLDSMPQNIVLFLPFPPLHLRIFSRQWHFLFPLSMAVSLGNVTEFEVGHFRQWTVRYSPAPSSYSYGNNLSWPDRFSFSSVSSYAVGFRRHAGILQAEVRKPAYVHPWKR